MISNPMVALSTRPMPGNVRRSRNHPQLAGARLLQAPDYGDLCRGLRTVDVGRTGVLIQQLFAAERRHRDTKVDAVEQRARDARAITRDLVF